MTKNISRLGLVCAALTAITLLSGCLIRPTRPVARPAQVVVTHPQPAPVVVATPAPRPVIVTTPAPRPVVVTTPPPQPVYVPHPAPVVVAPPQHAGHVSQGMITHPGHVVRFGLPISVARTVNIYVDGHGLDPTVAVTDGYGRRLGFNDDGGSGLDSQLRLTLAPGTYAVEVAGYGHSTGSFTVSIQ